MQRHPLPSINTHQALVSTLRSTEWMWHTGHAGARAACIVTHPQKTCMRLWKAADPDSSNLVTQALTDALWSDAVICLDRYCGAGSHKNEEDKQCGQKWHMVMEKSQSTTTAAAWGQACLCLGCSACSHASKLLLKVKNWGNHCYHKSSSWGNQRWFLGSQWRLYCHQFHVSPKHGLQIMLCLVILYLYLKMPSMHDIHLLWP